MGVILGVGGGVSVRLALGGGRWARRVALWYLSNDAVVDEDGCYTSRRGLESGSKVKALDRVRVWYFTLYIQGHWSRFSKHPNRGQRERAPELYIRDLRSKSEEEDKEK